MTSKRLTLALFLAIVVAKCSGDIMVQLNVNRPFNDVNEKFVSFSVKPEDLYSALDGPHRKTLTRMASMLGESYIKFMGDYDFSLDTTPKLRNPTRIVWKGFNRWTRAMNWSMVIPVPYKSNNWDPLPVLKILNSSQLIGISDCIWQLGTDFGTSRAQNYVTELKTLNLMVESFSPYVDDWHVMGADVVAGSSAEETRRYVDMSKDINTAFGWTESTSHGNNNNNINDNDPALKVMLAKNVPIWYSVPKKRRSSSAIPKINGRYSVVEATNGLHWARLMGEAASTGIDVLFKPLSLWDLENPSYDFYVTVLFKKVMGSRVFPARPLHLFTRSNKLYTHCANAVSGGIAFMVVNPGDSTMQISLRSMVKITANEVWQYTLWYKNGFAMLNEEKLSLNSTLSPQIRVKSANKPVLLTTPGMSVSFWVLPNVNLDHCQYTEIEAGEVKKISDKTASQKHYSSSDKLLQTLIQENSMVHGALSRAINRRRRYATLSERPKRLILENLSANSEKFAKQLKAFLFEGSSVKKRDAESGKNNQGVLQWIKSIIEGINFQDMPLLKRNRRSVDNNYFGPYFATKEGKKIGITKKITEIKKPEPKTKPIFDLKEFDEEEFFKKIVDQDEREWNRLPEGDIHLKHITNLEGDLVDDFNDEKSVHKKPALRMKKTQEPINEMRPLRLLPTEFYEALSIPDFKPMGNKMTGLGSALNTLFFQDAFTKKTPKNMKTKNDDKHHPTSADVEDLGTGNFKSDQLREVFRRSQKLLSGNIPNEQQNDPHFSREQEHISAGERSQVSKDKYRGYMGDKNENYFGENEDIVDREKIDPENDFSQMGIFKEIPWWHMNEKRGKRSLQLQIADDAWLSNVILKDDEVTPLGDSIKFPNKFVYKLESHSPKANKRNETISNVLVTTVKRKVSTFVDIISRHVSEWYKTLTKHFDVNLEESTRAPINRME